MLIKTLIVVALSLFLGGCIVTSHSHFDPTKGAPVSLRDGEFACVAEKRVSGSAEEFERTRIGRKLAQHFTAFSGHVQAMSLNDGSNRKLFIGKEDPTSASVYAFHDIGGGHFIAATGLIGEKNTHGGFMYLFFRIENDAIVTLVVRDEEQFKRLAEAAGLSYRLFIVSGPAEKERAFLTSLPTTGLLEPLTTCRPAAG